MLCEDGEEFIVSMPNKFRRHVYVRRDGYVVTEPIPEGVKVKAEIVRILQRRQIKYFNLQGVWPDIFKDTIYLDNSHTVPRKESDRGFVHGAKILYGVETSASDATGATGVAGEESSTATALKSPDVFSEATQASKVNVASSNGTESDSDSDDEELDLMPNYNKKAVSKIIFSDDEELDEDDDSSDKESAGSEDSDGSAEDSEVEVR